MLTFTHLSHLVSHLHELFGDRGGKTSYEFVPVSFEALNTSRGRPTAAAAQKCAESIPAGHAETVEAQSSVEDRVPETSTGENLELNFGDRVPSLTAEAIGDVSKLNKQRRRKAIRKESKRQNQKLTTSDVLKRTKRSQRDRQNYASRSGLRTKKLQALRTKYGKDSRFHKQRLSSSKSRYQLIHEKIKAHEAMRYHTNARVKNRMREYVVRRYNTDPTFQKRQKRYVVHRYDTDPGFKSRQKKYFVQRYHTDPSFRLHHIQRSSQQKRDRLAAKPSLRILYMLQCALRIRK